MELARALDQERVDYVLVGGVALALHGLVRASKMKRDTARPIDRADAAALRQKFGVGND